MSTTACDDQLTLEPTFDNHMSDVSVRFNETPDVFEQLQTTTRRAEAAEAELARLAQQKPVAWRHENGNIFLPWQKDLITTNAVFSPLYAAPVHAPAVLSVSSNVLEMLDGVFADTATGQKYLSEARALLQSTEAQASDKLQLTPAPTHPADRNAGEVRHENNV